MIGQTISHYRVLRKLGRGGMGVVYEADDLTLDRKIALKVLPPELAADEGRQRRFEREAKAVAALNHPNIVTLYSVEQADSHHFITMELVDGQRLSDLIPRKGLPVADLLRLAIQIADALAAAHERGIIHRDLKPSNVMVTRDGRVKVLDFGLAQLLVGAPSTASTADAIAGSDTAAGRIVGTFAYMSPEQAEGRPLDQRSDIFSLGVLLYEMATGERPFKGDSNVSLLSSIANDTPRFAAEVNPGIPVELARIIRRCLQKDRERRYQTAKDIRIELAELKEESDSGELRVKPPVPPRRSARWVLVISLVGLLVAAGVMLAVWLAGVGPFAQPAPAGERGTDAGKLSPIVTTAPVPVTHGPGWEAQPALSPDGSLIAYTSDESGNPDIWVTGVLGGGNAIRLTTDPGDDEEPAWFPDGSALAFASDRGGAWNVWTVPVLGGGPSLLVQNARDPSISPDGRLVAFVRNDALGSLRVNVAPLADTSRARRLTTGTGGLMQDEEDPAWSPDGCSICYWSDRRLWILPVSGGRQQALTGGSQYDTEPTWSADGRFVYFSSYRDGVTALWSVPASGGSPQRLTRGPGPERHPTVSRDGTRLAFSTLSENTDLVIRDLKTGREHALASTRDEVYPAFSPDGRTMVYVFDGTGNAITELWLQPLEDGRLVGPSRRLTSQPGAVSAPGFSPDGQWVVYQRVIGSSRDIWVVPATGGTPTQLTQDPAVDAYPSWSPDGRSIAFTSGRGESTRVWTMPVANGRSAGPARVVSSGPGMHCFPVWSPDGQFLAYVGEEEGNEVWIVRADGVGPARRVTAGARGVFARWAPDGAGLIVNGTWGQSDLSLRMVDVRTGASRPLNPPIPIGHPSTYPAFDISKDGRFVAFARGTWQGDIFVAGLLSR